MPLTMSNHQLDGILSLLAAFRARETGAYLAPGLISVVVGLIPFNHIPLIILQEIT